MRRRLPLILSTAALVVAVFGSTPLGEAALNQVVPRNSVGTVQLRNNAVTSTKVRNRSLRAVDFARGQLPRGAQGPAGPTGPAGPAGAPGANGAQGPPGISGLQVVFTTSANDSSSYKTLNATCPAAKRAIGGGVAISPASAATPVAVTRSYLSGTGTW